MTSKAKRKSYFLSGELALEIYRRNGVKQILNNQDPFDTFVHDKKPSVDCEKITKKDYAILKKFVEGN